MTMSGEDEIVASNYNGQPDNRRLSIGDLGILRTPKTETTLLGKSRTWRSLNKWEILYLTIALVTLVASLALSVERIINLQKQSADYTFAILLCWTTLMCFFHVIDGVKSEKACDLIVFVVTTIVVLCYVIVNYVSKRDDNIKLARMIVAIVFAPFLVGGGLKLAYEHYDSKSLIFRTVGANIQLQRMCEIVFVTSSLLKFDVQLGGSTYILYLDKGLDDLSVSELVIIGLGLFATGVWVILGFLAMRWENKIMVYVFFVSSIIEPSLIIYNLIRYSGAAFISLKIAVYASGVVALIVRCLTIVCMWKVMSNFGNGLGNKIFGSKPSSTEHQQSSNQVVTTTSIP